MLLDIAGISQDEVPELTRSMLKKVAPRILSGEASGDEFNYSDLASGQKNGLAMVAESVKHAGIENPVPEETADRCRNWLRTLYNWIGNEAGKPGSGLRDAFPFIHQLSNTGIVMSNLGIEYETDQIISDFLDFEVYHTDYENGLKDGNLPVLDMLYFAKLNGLDGLLRQKKAGNRLDERCAEGGNMSMTKTYIERSLKELFGDDWKAVYNGMKKSGDFIAKPAPPRKLRTPEEIRKMMTEDLGASIQRYSDPKTFMKAVDIIYRHNRVKDFFGAELPIPENLAKMEKKFFSEQTPEAIKGWLNGLVASYQPGSLSYSLDLPENIPEKEYALMRIMELSGRYLRMTDLLYDTPEKKRLMEGFSVPRFGFNGV